MSIVRHKISLSTEYVNQWSLQDALREVFQNGIDTQDWSFEYKNSTLKVISKGASLHKKFLLMGMSDKKEGSLGKHGEGLKLSSLVLCRLGFKPYILTGTEVWVPKLIKSRTYGVTQLIFDVTNGQPQSDNVIFVIPDITTEMFSELMDRNLHVMKPSTGWHTKYGHILSTDYAGKVFVGGLYVCNIKGMLHGYDIKPQFLSLDRDRCLVRDFDLQWITCQMWAATNDNSIILALIDKGADDVKYLDSFAYSVNEGLADRAAEAFLTEHGTDAIPVVDQYDIEKAKEQGHEKIIIVPKITRELLGRSSIWERPAPKIVPKRPREILLEFYTDHSNDWTELMRLQFSVILEQAEGWHL